MRFQVSDEYMVHFGGQPSGSEKRAILEKLKREWRGDRMMMEEHKEFLLATSPNDLDVGRARKKGDYTVYEYHIFKGSSIMAGGDVKVWDNGRVEIA